MTLSRSLRRQLLTADEFGWVERIMQSRARCAVARAIKSGVLKRPDACEICGRTKRLHAHHFAGYEEQHRLDVIWLCSPCHACAHHPELPQPDIDRAWAIRLSKPTAMSVLRQAKSVRAGLVR